MKVKPSGDRFQLGRRHSLPVDRECLLSIIVPVLNEERTIAELLGRLTELEIPAQIIVVNDGSTDGTAEVLNQLLFPRMTVVNHRVNLGKGAAIRTALPYCRGTAVVIQDADLEYDPSDLPRLLALLRSDQADVVYGNRFHGEQRVQTDLIHRAANGFITWATNRFLPQPLHDVESARCFGSQRRSRPATDPPARLRLLDGVSRG